MSNSTAKTKSVLSAFTMTRIAVLTALSVVLFLTIEIPIIAFYKLDFSNLPALLGAFAMGPVPALIILVLKTGIHLLIKGLGSTMGIGDLADLIMGLALVMPAAWIYKRNKNRKSALTGMAAGTLCMIVTGVLVNWLLLIPTYMVAYHMDIGKIVGMATKTLPFVDSEWKLLLFVTAPFNLIKGAAISLITFLIYKPLSPLLHMKQPE